MDVISLINNKGGTGKTSICLNLAALSSQERKTLVIDLDDQENASYVFKNKVSDVIYQYREEDLYLLKDDLDGKLNRRYLSKYNYDRIFIDTKAYLDEDIIDVIKMSDLVIVPILLDVYSMQGLGKILALILKYNAVAKVVIAPNLTIHNSKLHKSMYRELKKSLGKKYIISDMISSSVKMQESVREDAIYILDAKRSRLSKSINKLYGTIKKEFD